MADGEKTGKTQIQKFEYVENENSFFGEIKTFSFVFEELPFGKKKKKIKIKIADTSFKGSNYFTHNFSSYGAAQVMNN